MNYVLWVSRKVYSRTMSVDRIAMSIHEHARWIHIELNDVCDRVVSEAIRIAMHKIDPRNLKGSELRVYAALMVLNDLISRPKRIVSDKVQVALCLNDSRYLPSVLRYKEDYCRILATFIRELGLDLTCRSYSDLYALLLACRCAIEQGIVDRNRCLPPGITVEALMEAIEKELASVLEESIDLDRYPDVLELCRDTFGLQLESQHT